MVMPGILGSRLVDAEGRVVWGSLPRTLLRFGDLELPRPEARLGDPTAAGRSPRGARTGVYDSLLKAIEGMGFRRRARARPRWAVGTGEAEELEPDPLS